MDEILAEKIANQLRRDILRGKLAPGASVKERDNATDMGVSRTPMREAIRILAKEGLVTLRPSRSPIVADPDLKEVIDAVEVLGTLELLSGDLACMHATDREIAGIRALHKKMVAEHGRINSLDFFEIDMQFHLEIARASHNRSLAETHSAYLSRLWRARYLSARIRRGQERAMAQHGAIAEGLASRDAGRVRREITSHLEHLGDNIRELFADRGPGIARPGVA